MSSSAQRLPLNVLAHIFKFAEPKFDDFGVTSNFEYYMHFIWVNLSLVCRQWREAFLSSPDLWTTIIWRPRRKEYIRAALKRSTDRPLRVYALANPEDEGSYEWDVELDEEEEEPDTEMSKQLPKIAYLNKIDTWDDDSEFPVMMRNYYDPEDFLKDIAEHIDRVRSFHLTIPGIRFKALSEIFTAPAPQLETLTVGTSPRHGTGYMKHKTLPRLFGGRAPALRQLTLKHFTGWHLPFARDLTHLSLQRLDLDDPSVCEMFLDTLHVARNLAVLIVDMWGRERDAEMMPVDELPIRLDRLQTLAVNGNSPSRVTNLLSHLELPPSASIVLTNVYNEDLDSFFPKDRSHLLNLQDPFELILTWESSDYATPLIKRGDSDIPVFGTTSVRVDNFAEYIRSLGNVFDLNKVRRLSSYNRDYDEARDHEPQIWQEVFKVLPNLQAIHLYNYEPFTLLSSLLSCCADEDSTHPGLFELEKELDGFTDSAEVLDEEVKEMAEEYELAKDDDAQPWHVKHRLSPYLRHKHGVARSKSLDVPCQKNPAQAWITCGCRWQYGDSGSHQMFVQTSIVSEAALQDARMTSAPVEELDSLRPWCQQWALHFGSWLVVPSLLAGPYKI